MAWYYKALILKEGELKHIIYIDTPTPTEKITCLFEQQFMFPSEYFQPITADIKNRIVVCSQKGLIAEDAPCVIAIDENSLFQQKWQAQPLEPKPSAAPAGSGQWRPPT